MSGLPPVFDTAASSCMSSSARRVDGVLDDTASSASTGVEDADLPLPLPRILMRRGLRGSVDCAVATESFADGMLAESVSVRARVLSEARKASAWSSPPFAVIVPGVVAVGGEKR